MKKALSQIIFFIPLIIFLTSCFQHRLLERNLGEEKDNLSHWTLESADRSKLPVWIKGNPNSEHLIVFLNGGPGSPSLDYRIYFRDLEKSYMICYFDQRGAGFSFSKKKNLTISRYVEDLEQLTDMLKKIYPTKKFVLWGHSWGGFLGIKYLSSSKNQANYTSWIEMSGGHNFPLLFKSSKEFTLETAYKMQNEKREDSTSWRNIISKIELQKPNTLKGAMEINDISYKSISLLKLPKREVKKPKIDFLTSFLFVAQSDKVKENLDFGREIITASVSEDIEKIKIPTLLIWGKLDLVSPPQALMQDAFSKLSSNPKRDTLLLENTGHGVMRSTLFPGVIDKINNFLKSN